VNIDFRTGDADGIKAVGAIAIEELKKLGGSIETVSSAPAVGDNIVATFTGAGKGTVLLMAHMDTVFAKGAAKARPFRIDRGRAYGPGVSDDKAGIVAGITMLKILGELKFKDYARITLFLNTNEETGSRGLARADREARERARRHAQSRRRAGPATASRSGARAPALSRVEVKGRASHAGGSPELGRNAVMELAHQMLQLSKLADNNKGTTVNFTIAKGGDRKNVIPDYAEADADVRAGGFRRVRPRRTRSRRGDQEQADCRHRSDGNADADISGDATERADRRARRHGANAIYGEIGKTLQLGGSGGAADSSLSAGVFKPTLDGLSLIGGNAHTDREYAEVDSMVPRLYLLTRMVMELGRKP